MSRPIVFTVDHRYLRPLAVALESLRRCGTHPRQIVVVHHRLARRHRRRLSNWLAGSHLQLRFLALTPPSLGRALPHHFTPATLLRLVMVEHLPFEEMIYVDADVIFCGPLDPLDQLDLGGVSLVASVRPGSRDLRQHGFGIVNTYFSSSLLLINRRNFLEEGLGRRSLELLASQPFEFPDQDALNLCCRSWRPLPAGLSVELEPQGPALNGLPEAAVLLQLAGADKPWHPLNSHPARLLFDAHLRATPYRWALPGPADCRWRSLASRLRQRLIRSFKAATAWAQAVASGCWWRPSA
jgi:lipopolysaccharide biosynthesis glycosyltransferase